MPRLYSEEELRELTLFQSLEEARRCPADAVRLYLHNTGEDLVGIAELSCLRELSVSWMDIRPLLPHLGKLPLLQSLTLRNVSLEQWPDGVFGMENLQRLDLSQNNLRELPDGILRLQRLNYLGVDRNQIETVPQELGNLPELEYLNLHCNQLRSLPASIGSLSRLRVLNLYNNQLATLPPEISQLTGLEHLSLKYNPFENLPECLSGFCKIPGFEIEGEKRRLFMDWTYVPRDLPPRMEVAEMGLSLSPGDPLHTSLLAALAAENLMEAAFVILRAARPAVEIESTEPDDYSVPGNSRFGGFPDLPGPEDFPAPENGCPWYFLAQFNLADLAPHVRFLPPSGLLSFFVQTADPFGAKVLFFPDDPARMVTVRYEHEDPVSWDNFTQQPHRLRFMRFLSLPHHLKDSPFPPSSGEEQRYEWLVRNPDHQINGDTSAHEDAADSLGGWAEEWVPLLRLGYDDKAGFCFGDAGIFYFSIHREALRRWDFSNIHLNMECG
jgi:uncharacterized protein YwqG